MAKDKRKPNGAGGRGPGRRVEQQQKPEGAGGRGPGRRVEQQAAVPVK